MRIVRESINLIPMYLSIVYIVRQYAYSYGYTLCIYKFSFYHRRLLIRTKFIIGAYTIYILYIQMQCKF